MLVALGLAMLLPLVLGACGVVYTAPSIGGSRTVGSAETDYDVAVVRLTTETARAANLAPYQPPRLPLAFQPDAAARSVGRSPAAPQLAALPLPSMREEQRPGTIVERFPPLLAPQPYRIGVSDLLLLTVTSPTTSVEALPGLLSAQARRNGYIVQDDGAIAVPEAGRVRVSGLTLQEAEAAIFDALVRAGIDPSFSLEIAEFNSQRVAVGGEVRNPTLAPITLKPLFLHEAIGLAGGLAVLDNSVARVELTRRGETFRIALERFLSDPAARQIVLRDGDAVYVGSAFREDAAQVRFQQELALRSQVIAETQFTLQIEEIRAQREETARSALSDERQLFKDRLELGAVARDHAYLTGEIQPSLRIPLPFERRATLADALYNDTRLQIQFADFGEIYVLRAETDPDRAGGLTAFHLDAENAANLALATTFELRPNDVIFVAEQPITSWNRVVSQILPNLFISAVTAATGN